MKQPSWLRRILCPRCIPAGPERPGGSPRVMVVLGRTAALVDRTIEDVRRIRNEMANDDNPLLGEKPRVPRRDRP